MGGVELAGEIAAQYPGKKINLVHSGDKLLNNTQPPLHPRVSELAQSKLEALGVKVALNRRVTQLPNPLPVDSFLSTTANYVLSDGSEISADVAIVATGSLPQKPLIAEATNDLQQIKVDDKLHVEGYNNVYCVEMQTMLQKRKWATRQSSRPSVYRTISYAEKRARRRKLTRRREGRRNTGL